MLTLSELLDRGCADEQQLLESHGAGFVLVDHEFNSGLSAGDPMDSDDRTVITSTMEGVAMAFGRAAEEAKAPQQL